MAHQLNGVEYWKAISVHSNSKRSVGCYLWHLIGFWCNGRFVSKRNRKTLENKHQDHNRIWKLENNSENYIELLSNNYNEPLNNVCNAKIKEITEIGN